MRKASPSPNFPFFLCPLWPLLLPLMQLEDSQALHAYHPKSWSFLKLWSRGTRPLSWGTQFKWMSVLEKFHLSSSAKNNHRERLCLKAKSHPQAWYCAHESLEKGALVHLILNICVRLVQIHGLVHTYTHMIAYL